MPKFSTALIKDVLQKTCFTLIFALLFTLSVTSQNSFAASSDAPIAKTASGLIYQDLAVGRGAEAVVGRNVQVHYTGWLQNPDGSAGQKFDSSVDRGEPFEFQLGAGRVIRGWDEGVAGMRVGGVRKLLIPSKLGYGAQGAAGVIPPNSTLIFDVELINLK